MRLLCLSLALAIIYIMAIVRSSRIEARATRSAAPDSSSSSSSSESWEVPAKPATPVQTVEAFALGIPTVNAGLYWTELAFETMFNNSMQIADKIKLNACLAQIVQEYLNQSVTW